VIAGVVLAAGTSSRLGRPKQLLPLAGEPLLRHTVRATLTSKLDAVLIVLGHEADAVRAAVADLPVRIVFNPDYALGQSTSVRAGVDALSPQTEAALFLLGDQPSIAPATIDALIQTWRDTNAPIVAPRYVDGIGNPVLFARRVFPELMSLAGARGARAIVKTYQQRGLLSVFSVDQPMPPDIDTEADYAALLAATQSPSPRARGEGSRGQE
jgi:molybdenum cofactor cytidylyltransferase